MALYGNQAQKPQEEKVDQRIGGLGRIGGLEGVGGLEYREKVDQEDQLDQKEQENYKQQVDQRTGLPGEVGGLDVVGGPENRWTMWSWWTIQIKRTREYLVEYLDYVDQKKQVDQSLENILTR